MIKIVRNDCIETFDYIINSKYYIKLVSPFDPDIFLLRSEKFIEESPEVECLMKKLSDITGGLRIGNVILNLNNIETVSICKGTGGFSSVIVEFYNHGSRESSEVSVGYSTYSDNIQILKSLVGLIPEKRVPDIDITIDIPTLLK